MDMLDPVKNAQCIFMLATPLKLTKSCLQSGSLN